MTTKFSARRRAILIAMFLAPGGCGGGSSGGGDDLPPECASYVSQGAPAFVMVRVVNQSASSIWVETGCSEPFDLRIDGESKTPFLSFPAPTCDAIQQGSPPCCDCFPTKQEILPGAVYDKKWAQVFHEEVDMPLSCVPEDLQAEYDGCHVSRPIPSQGLEMVAEIRRCTDDTCPLSEQVSAAFSAGQDPIDVLVH